MSEDTVDLLRMEPPPLSSSVLRRAEKTDLSLGSLQAIAAIRARLDMLEKAAMVSAKEKGATNRDIAEALNLTTQTIYYRFRGMRRGEGNLSIGRGRRRKA
jgi:predicted transcriptional regulator